MFRDSVKQRGLNVVVDQKLHYAMFCLKETQIVCFPCLGDKSGGRLFSRAVVWSVVKVTTASIDSI